MTAGGLFVSATASLIRKPYLLYYLLSTLSCSNRAAARFGNESRELKVDRRRVSSGGGAGASGQDGAGCGALGDRGQTTRFTTEVGEVVEDTTRGYWLALIIYGEYLGASCLGVLAVRKPLSLASASSCELNVFQIPGTRFQVPGSHELLNATYFAARNSRPNAI